jgi:hypothetical protein
MKEEETIQVKVAYPAHAESEKSWCFLTVVFEKGAHSQTWFPKKNCKVEKIEGENFKAILTLPLWLYQSMKNKGVVFTEV